MSWLFNARRYKLDFPTKFQNLVNQFNAKVTDDSADEGEDLQTSTEGSVARNYLKFCDFDLASVKTFDDDTPASMLAFEPDFDTCKLFIEFDSLGKEVTDYSGFNHHAKTFGVGRVHNGIDYGQAQSVEMILDGRSCYAEISDSEDIQISSITDSFSLFFRFLPFSLDKSGGYRQVVCCKVDTADTDWWSFEISENGNARFNMVLDSTEYTIVTPDSVISATSYSDLNTESTRYDVAVTFDLDTDTLKLFINNTKYDTVSNTLDTDTQQPDSSLNNNLMVGRWADIVDPATGEKYAARNLSKLYHGVFQQLKFFKDKLVTDDEVGYHYTNKLSISDIPFGQVALGGTMILDEDS